MAQFLYYTVYTGDQKVKRLTEAGAYVDASSVAKGWQGGCVDNDGNLWLVAHNQGTYRGLVNRNTGALTITAADSSTDSSITICVGSDGALYRITTNDILRAVPAPTLSWVSTAPPSPGTNWINITSAPDGSLIATSYSKMYRGVIANGAVTWTQFTVVYGATTASIITNFSSVMYSTDGFIYILGYETNAYRNRMYRGTVAGSTITFDELASANTSGTTWLGLRESADKQYLYFALENDTHISVQNQRFSKSTGTLSNVGSTTTLDFRGVLIVDTDAPVVSLVGTTEQKVTVATRRAQQISDYAFVDQNAPALAWRSIKHDALGYIATIGDNTVRTSTDGVTWNTVTVAGVSEIQSAVRNATYMFLGTTSSLYRANLDGTSPVAIGTDILYRKQDVHIASDGSLWLATASDPINDPGAISRSTDNGTTFTDVYATNHISFDGISSDTAGNVYLVSRKQSTIFKTPDNGATWSEITHPLTPAESIAVGPNGEIAVGGYGSATLRISFDSGVTWSAMSLTPTDVDGLCFDTSGNLWVTDFSTKKIWKASSSKTYITTDGTTPLPYATGTYTDSRDGRVYKTVRMPDNKWWFAENFAYVSAGSWDYDNAVSKRAVYGRLYTYADASASAPTGCRLPTSTEYTTLVGLCGTTTLAGKRLKANNSRWVANTGYDTYGFNALPGGLRGFASGTYSYISTFCSLWSATVVNTGDPGTAYYFGLDDAADGPEWPMVAGSRTNGMSVRYIVDSGNVPDITNVSTYTATIPAVASGVVKSITVTGAGSKSAVSTISIPTIFASANKVYASVASGYIYSVDAVTGAETALTSTSRAWEGVCAGPVGSNKLYAAVNGGYIYKIDALTGAETQITATAAYWRGPVYNPITKYLYAIAGDNVGQNCYVYQIDPVTGVTVQLTSTPRVFNGSLAVNSNGDMWVGISAGKILQINAVTGAESTLPQSIVADWQDLCYSADTGFLYGVTSNTANTVGSVYKIHPVTGATTQLGTNSGIGYEGVTWDYKNARLLVSQNTQYISYVNPNTGAVTALTAVTRSFRGIDYAPVYSPVPQITYTPPAGTYTATQTVAIAPVTGTFTDARDGKVYKTVLMPDGKWWSSENLAYAGYGVDYNNNIANRAIYGRLYTKADAVLALPSGTHIPSAAEWDALIASCGGTAIAGSRLKASSSLWSTNTGTDNYGFAALPSGYGSSDGSFGALGDTAYIQSSTSNAGQGYWTYRISATNTTAGQDDAYVAFKFPVRFIVDSGNVQVNFVYYTVDGSNPVATTYPYMDKSISVPGPYDACFGPNGRIVAGCSSSIYYGDVNGVNWVNAEVALATWQYYGICYNAVDGNYYVANYTGGIYRISADFKTKTAVGNSANYPFKVRASTDGTIYAIGIACYKSTDFGATWTLACSPPGAGTYCSGAFLPDGRLLLVTGDGSQSTSKVTVYNPSDSSQATLASVPYALGIVISTAGRAYLGTTSPAKTLTAVAPYATWTDFATGLTGGGDSNGTQVISCNEASQKIVMLEVGDAKTGNSYTTPITIATTKTVKAISVAGGVSTTISPATYTLNLNIPMYASSGGTYHAVLTTSIRYNSAWVQPSGWVGRGGVWVKFQ